MSLFYATLFIANNFKTSFSVINYFFSIIISSTNRKDIDYNLQMYPHVAKVQWEEGAFRLVFGEIKITYTNKWLIL